MPREPFAVLPVAPKGDQDLNSIYTQVGRALSMWEGVEENLARLFALVLGVDAYDQPSPAAKAYGAILTASGRIEMLKAASETYFWEDKKTRQEVSDLLNKCIKCAARRNEIAHGVCYSMKFTFLEEEYGDEGFYLVPPFYNTEKMHKWRNTSLEIPTDAKSQKAALNRIKNDIKDGFGKYKYNSEQIGMYADHFAALEKEVRDLVIRLAGVRRAWLGRR